ncbi:hypothetical protein ABT115_26905 [Streptomyces sp. NPDC001832]|uniref:hypothetical protein n=1 Tax=Streptomyces sp. NPDC001832 TaxID=3154527 RepID=UPI0033249CB4
MPGDAARGDDGRREGAGQPLTGLVRGLLAGHGRSLYGIGLVATAVTAVLGLSVLAAGFAMIAGPYATAWREQRITLAQEDAASGYAGHIGTVYTVGAVVTASLVLLAFLVLGLLHTAHAVAADRYLAGARQSTIREVWQRTRPRLGAALRVQVLTAARVGTAVLPGLVLWLVLEARLIPGVQDRLLTDTRESRYELACQGVLLATVVVGFYVASRLCTATAALVLDELSPREAVRRSWALTRGARARTFGVCLLLTLAVGAAFLLLREAAHPLVQPAETAMSWISDDNPYMTAALVTITRSTVGLLLLPAVISPPVCSALALMYGGRARGCGAPNAGFSEPGGWASESL